MNIDINQLVSTIAPNFNLSQTASPSSLYYNLLVEFTWVVAIVAVLVIIYSGVQYITAAGDAERAERAKKTMIGAIIGIIVVIVAYAAFNTTMRILGTSGATTQQVQQQINQSP